MHLRLDLPELTPEECRRFWLTPEETLDVAGMYREGADSSDPARKLFSNMVERGYVVGRKAGTARTSPRLFSLEGAIKAGVMFHLTRAGQSFDVASDIGDATAELVRSLSKRALMSSDLISTKRIQHTVIAHFGLDGRCRTEVVSNPRANIFRLQSINPIALVMFHASPFLDRALERYALRLLAAKERQGASE